MTALAIIHLALIALLILTVIAGSSLRESNDLLENLGVVLIVAMIGVGIALSIVVLA